MLAGNSLLVVLLCLLSTPVVARRKKAYRATDEKAHHKMEVDSNKADSDKVVQAKANEVVASESQGQPATLCQYLDSQKELHLDSPKFTLSISCQSHEKKKWNDKDLTMYKYDVHIQGPEGDKTSFSPSPLRPTFKVEEGTGLKFQIPLGVPSSIGALDETLGPLWSDLGEDLNKCQWMIMGPWNLAQHNLPAKLQLKCHRPDSYFHHTFAQDRSVAKEDLNGPFTGDKMKICNFLKSEKVSLETEGGSWNMLITCNVSKYEKLFSSALTTYQYEVLLEGPDGEKASFKPEPQRPSVGYLKEESSEFDTGKYVVEIELGASKPTGEALGLLWPGLGKAIDHCQWILLGDEAAINRPGHSVDPELRLKCNMPDSYWYHTFKS